MMGKKRFGRASRITTRRLRWKKQNPSSASYDRLYCSHLRVQLRRLNQSLDPGFDSQEPEKLSSDVTTTSISMPDQSAGIKKEVGSKASLRACSARMEKNTSDDHLKGSDQYLPDSVKFDTQEELSSHVTTTSMPDQGLHLL